MDPPHHVWAGRRPHHLRRHQDLRRILNVTINESRGTPQSKPLKPHRIVPLPRNDDVVNRSGIFSMLERLLPPSLDYQSAALWGLGGSGKTRIALEYAYRRRRDAACSVFWVHADNETTFTQDYKSIAKKLSLANNLDGEEPLTAVRERIETDPCWLLVLDNPDNLGLFGVGRAPQRRSQTEAMEEAPTLYTRSTRTRVLYFGTPT